MKSGQDNKYFIGITELNLHKNPYKVDSYKYTPILQMQKLKNRGIK